MKYELIAIVQDMLNDTDGDEVNSIDDTTESTQAAYIVRSTFDNIITNSKIDFYRRAVQFDGVSDTSHPNYLKMPDNIQELCVLNYNVSKENGKTDYQRVWYLSPEEFLEHQNMLNSALDNVKEVRDFDGLVYHIQTDKAPEFWTSFDDEYIALDSYNLDVEDTIHKNKTQGIAYVSPKFELRDDYIPDMPSDMFPYLISESKAAFSLKIRQMQSQDDEKWSTLHRRRMSRKSWQANGGISTPNYGKRAVGGRRNPYFNKN